MSANFLTAAAELLEKIALGAGDPEIDRVVEALQEAARGERTSSLTRNSACKSARSAGC